MFVVWIELENLIILVVEFTPWSTIVSKLWAHKNKKKLFSYYFILMPSRCKIYLLVQHRLQNGFVHRSTSVVMTWNARERV